MRIQIEGDPEQRDQWTATAGCPMSKEETKSPFCRFFNECELLQIEVKAESPSEAITFIDYATATDGIPNCFNGKPFLTKMFGETIYPH